MSFTMVERSESPPRASKLSQIFHKNRSQENTTRDSASDSAKGSESSGHRGVRHSLEATVDKIKASNNIGGDGDVNANGIKKVVPKGIGSRRRKKKQEQEDERRASEEAARGRSVGERGTLENDSGGLIHGSGDGSSLITYDSDNESPLETPPQLSTHPSHIGYLPTSSPLVHSSVSPQAAISEAQVEGTPAPRATTLPITADNLAAAESASTLHTANLRVPASEPQKRSPSPVGRLKDALKPRRGRSPNTSPERTAGAGGLGSTQKEKLGENKRGSVVSKLGSIFPDRHSSQPRSTASSPERPRSANIQRIEAKAPPSTPPSGDNAAPIIVNTPPTPTGHSSPRFSTFRERGTSEPVAANPHVVISPSGNMISHRRVSSGSASLGPSKLSNIISVPVTPAAETGSTIPGQGPQGGFFSTVLSAAQNAANTLSNSIANTTVNTGGSRSRSGTQELQEVENPEVESLGEKADSEGVSQEKELAVKTLGVGDLSLSHLGISENTSGANTPMASKFPEEVRGRSESTNGSLPINGPAAASISAAELGDAGPPAYVDDHQPLVRPRSMFEPVVSGEQTPPNGSVFEGKTIKRSGSIRSAIGSRRKRGSSAATGGTIGAAIAAANASVAHPSAKGSTPKITGFAVASKKRNRDFHQLFRSVPDDDYLIEDYSCALQREILAHGRLYVSEGHLCFSSNIFGWVTTLVMSFDEIVSVEKRSTALVFKNGLMISTLHAKHVFASFTSRDSTYELIVGIWKLGHPSLRSSLNGVTIDETGGGDKTEKDDGNAIPGSQSESESTSEGEGGDEVYDEDEEDEDGISYSQVEGSVAGSDIGEKVVSRKPSAAVVTNGTPAERGKEDSPTSPSPDFPGPVTHPPTDCTDAESHFSRILGDEIIPAPLGKVYSLMFGPASLTWMRNWLTVEQKSLELSMDDKKSLTPDNKVRSYSYIKPLNGAIGPKQTKCISTENLDFFDLERAVTVTISTQTPDVPSGNVFTTKTKYCLTWAEGNVTRLQMNCTIEWTGKSWLKAPIEKGANDGQNQYARDITASLKAAVSSRRGAAVPATGKSKKKGRKGRDAKGVSQTTDGASDVKPRVETWGVLEPLHGILGPLVDISRPLLTGNILYGLLVGLLVASWFRFGSSGRGGAGRELGVGLFGTPERIAAYEELWKREESELWAWLEDRVGMEKLRDVGKMPIEAKNLEDRLQDETMEQREIEAAIRVTEEKLQVLKSVVGKKKHGSKAETSIAKARPKASSYSSDGMAGAA